MLGMPTLRYLYEHLEENRPQLEYKMASQRLWCNATQLNKSSHFEATLVGIHPNDIYPFTIYNLSVYTNRPQILLGVGG